jgi:hypothetical protein
MENWKNQLNELMNEHRFFPFENWNYQLGLWCKEWIDELGKRSGIHATTSSYLSDKKISVSVNGETPFVIYLKYSLDQQTGMPGLVIRYTTEHHPLRKLKAIMKGEDIEEDELKDYTWMEEMLTMIDGPILEKEFVLDSITYDLRKWLSR